MAEPGERRKQKTIYHFYEKGNNSCETRDEGPEGGAGEENP